LYDKIVSVGKSAKYKLINSTKSSITQTSIASRLNSTAKKRAKNNFVD